MIYFLYHLIFGFAPPWLKERKNKKNTSLRPFPFVSVRANGNGRRPAPVPPYKRPSSAKL